MTTAPRGIEVIVTGWAQPQRAKRRNACLTRDSYLGSLTLRRLLPFLLLVLPLLVACAPRLRNMRDNRDRAALEEAVRGYWDGIRWNDPSRAGSWLAKPAEQLALGRLLSEPRYRVSDVTIVQIALGDELPEERAPETREATALVRLEVADAVRYRGETVTVEQHWIKRAKAWYVDTARSPLGADRPW